MYIEWYFSRHSYRENDKQNFSLFIIRIIIWRFIMAIYDLSDSNFRKIFDCKELQLPIVWDGEDFASTVNELFDFYLKKVEKELPLLMPKTIKEMYIIKDIRKVCEKIKRTIECYFNGYPFDAYFELENIMSFLMQNDSFDNQKMSFGKGSISKDLNLFRAVKVGDQDIYDMGRVFHIPFDLRSKVSSSRYSIAGFPSLYLGTNLTLCCEEINYEHNKGFALASRFNAGENVYSPRIRIIDLSIKPSDLYLNNSEDKSNNINAVFSKCSDTEKDNFRTNYLLWYPLIAVCSYVHSKKEDPFAAEYIVPQLLMQWIRKNKRYTNEILGIKYFSCASKKAADMGYNYVFPVLKQDFWNKQRYCPILSQAFRLTKPKHISKYTSIVDCEAALNKETLFNFY